jgi:3',5'-cyclic-AMP phosphodiesterase
MPVSPFIAATRRHWIRQNLAAGLGTWWTWSGAGAEEAETDGEFWALLSDPHIAADENLEARGVVMAANLRRTVAQVLKTGVKPHGVLINGDCAFLDGQEADYSQLLRCLRPLAEERVQVHCTLGNHDDRSRFRAANAQPGVDPVLADKHVTILSSARVNWVLLDSLQEVNSTPGLLGGSQLGWLERTLDRIPTKPTFVMVHHNPQSSAPDGGKVNGLTDTAELLRILKASPRVKALFYGHTHQWQVQPPRDGLPWLINLPPVSYTFSPSAPAGWVTARVTSEQLSLELRSLNPDHPQHREKVAIPLV